MKCIRIRKKYIELVKHLKGIENIEVAILYNNMAGTLREQGKYDKALELYKDINDDRYD